MTDFVIYLGDVITANNIMIGNASLYWDQATSPAYLGLAYSETMMMLHFSGHWTGSLLLEFLQFIVLKPVLLVQV
jgi:hypothetical protein